jgi:hypothetical protein
MSDLIERISTLPRLVLGTATTAAGAVVSTNPEAIPVIQAQPEMHWMQIAVWAATILAGLGTFGLAVVRGVIEIRKSCQK